MPTIAPELQKAADVYADFMREIKTRLGAIKACVDYLAANPRDERGYLQAEFAFLQRRFVCDLVALAALAAHHPYVVSPEILESWHARRLLQDLSDKHPNCFPRPVKQLEGEHLFFMEGPEVLTLKKLQKIFDSCGKLLHRGRLDHILKGQMRVYDMPTLDRWARQIGQSMSNHVCMIPDEGVMLVVSLHGGVNDDVIVAIAVANGPFDILSPKTPEPSPSP